MILGVKAFTPRLTAIKGAGEYQYKPGKNVTEKAKCANTGFHLCEDPLDCLSYYDWDGKNQFWAVAAGGDIDEDEQDTRISCTELTLIRRISAEEFLLLHANYAMWHPSGYHDQDKGPFHITYKGTPISGQINEWLCSIDGAKCVIVKVDGIKVLPGVKYTLAELEEATNEKSR